MASIVWTALPAAKVRLPVSSSSSSSSSSSTSRPPVLRCLSASPSSTFTFTFRFSSLPSNPNSKTLQHFRCFSALTPELKTTIDEVITSNKVVLFMKGTKDSPRCGFSNTVVQILKSSNVPFETIDILENKSFRQAMKEYSSWPTFPQLYIDGEFFGGCDITVEAFKSGELQELLEKAMCS